MFDKIAGVLCAEHVVVGAWNGSGWRLCAGGRAWRWRWHTRAGHQVWACMLDGHQGMVLATAWRWAARAWHEWAGRWNLLFVMGRESLVMDEGPESSFVTAWDGAHGSWQSQVRRSTMLINKGGTPLAAQSIPGGPHSRA
jgi:hypothetical protein